MAKVYIPQEPSRLDLKFNIHVPTVDLRPAEAYGELVVMLPPNVTGALMSPLVDALKDRLKDFTEEDYLVAIGEPSLIAAASGIILRKQKLMKLLRWNKREKRYAVVEVKL